MTQGVSLTFAVNGAGTDSWTYNGLYNYSSGLAQIAGAWGELPGMDGPVIIGGERAPFTIDGNGIISEHSADGTCALSGQVSLIDPNHNAYSIAIIYSAGCEYPGATGTGLAYLDYTVSPTALRMTINLQASGSTETFAIIELPQ